MRVTHEKAIIALFSNKTGVIGKSDKIIKSADGELVWLYHSNPIVIIERSGAIYIDWHGYVKSTSTSERIYALYDYKGVPRPDRGLRESRYRARVLEGI